MNDGRLPLSAMIIGTLRLVARTGLLLAIVFLLVCQMHEYERLIVPIKERVEADDVEKALLNLGASDRKVGQLAEAVRHAARATNLPRDSSLPSCIPSPPSGRTPSPRNDTKA